MMQHRQIQTGGIDFFASFLTGWSASREFLWESPPDPHLCASLKAVLWLLPLIVIPFLHMEEGHLFPLWTFPAKITKYFIQNKEHSNFVPLKLPLKSKKRWQECEENNDHQWLTKWRQEAVVVKWVWISTLLICWLNVHYPSDIQFPHHQVTTIIPTSQG